MTQPPIQEDRVNKLLNNNIPITTLIPITVTHHSNSLNKLTGDNKTSSIQSSDSSSSSSSSDAENDTSTSGSGSSSGSSDGDNLYLSNLHWKDAVKKYRHGSWYKTTKASTIGSQSTGYPSILHTPTQRATKSAANNAIERNNIRDSKPTTMALTGALVSLGCILVVLIALIAYFGLFR